jgi:hypothetical protein
MLTYIPLSMRGGHTLQSAHIRTASKMRGVGRYEDGIIGRADQDKRNKKFTLDLSTQDRNKHGKLVSILWM